MEKVLRAYIPKESVRTFDAFLSGQVDVDIWLSTRLIRDKYNLTLEEAEKYKYLNEFRVKNLDLLKQIEKNQKIKFQVLIDDVRKYLNSKSSIKKRFIDKRRNIVGKYVSHGEVKW